MRERGPNAPGALFRAARERLPSKRYPGSVMGRQEFADECNAWLADRLNPDGPVTENAICKIESGKVTFPREWRRAAYRRVLGVATDAELGIFDRRRTPTEAAGSSSPVTGDAPRDDCATGSAFAARLKDLRLRHGYSLRRLGRLVHYSHGYLWDLENGHKPPTTEVAAALDQTLNAAGGLSALVAHPDTSHIGGSAQTWTAEPVAVHVRVSPGAEVTVVRHDGDPGRVSVLVGSVRVLVDASVGNEGSHAPIPIDAPMAAGGARVYSISDRRRDNASGA